MFSFFISFLIKVITTRKTMILNALCKLNRLPHCSTRYTIVGLIYAIWNKAFSLCILWLECHLTYRINYRLIQLEVPQIILIKVVASEPDVQEWRVSKASIRSASDGSSCGTVIPSLQWIIRLYATDIINSDLYDIHIHIIYYAAHICIRNNIFCLIYLILNCRSWDSNWQLVKWRSFGKAVQAARWPSLLL